ncbi:MAG: hypothetical protein ACQCN6_09150 [Candidatus Bathyarchaeia archaeon]|jgi:sugar lactone lactonase YvrE
MFSRTQSQTTKKYPLTCNRQKKLAVLLLITLLATVCTFTAFSFSGTATASEPLTEHYISKFGGNGAGAGQFVSPMGIAVDSSDNIYVSDNGNGRVEKFSSTYTFLGSIGSNGSGEGQLYHPAGIAVDSSDNLYVADMGNNRIVEFNSSGAFMRQWSSPACGDIAVSPSGDVYVSALTQNQIRVYSPTGNPINQWGSAGSGNGNFNSASGVAVDSSGNVYVADMGNNRTQKFTSDGTFITSWGSSGSGDGQFAGPIDTAVDNSGHVYVTDWKNNRVEIFDSDGTYVGQFGTAGTGDGQFNGPWRTAFDSAGDVYVVEMSNCRVQKFSTTVPSNPTPTPTPTGTQKVSAPDIETTSDLTYGAGYGMSLLQGSQVHLNLCVRNMSDSTFNSTDWQLNLFSNLNGSEYVYQVGLISMHPASGLQGSPSSKVYITCLGNTIPIYFYDCSSFDMETTDITYVDDVPVFSNTITFHDIEVDTYGHGDSSVTLSFTQTFIANWTEFKIKSIVSADLSNLKLYTSGGSEIPHGSDFALNFNYAVALFNQTQVNLQGNVTNIEGQPKCVLEPTDISPTNAYYIIPGVANLNYTLANIGLADNYIETLGATQTNKVASARFYIDPGFESANMLETFSNLTYGSTTSILSDPIVTITHEKVAAEPEPTSPPTTSSSSSSSSPSSSSGPRSSTPTVPELSILALSSLMLLILSAAAVIKLKRHNTSSIGS